jgi:23S rRNA (uridine2552-2'-O)-methyltransferase
MQIKRFRSNLSWLQRHVKDQYVQKSVQQDLRSRSAFKLKEIQNRFRIIKPHDFVLDMGAAPGGWSLVCSTILSFRNESAYQTSHTDSSQSTHKVQPPQRSQASPLLIAIDLLPFPEIPNCHILQGDANSTEILDKVRSIAEGRLADVILSDMMVNMSGQKAMDHFRSMDLCRSVLHLTPMLLKPRGNLLLKYFRGEDEKELLTEVQKQFTLTNVIKPDASRSESSEMYLLGVGYKKPSS